VTVCIGSRLAFSIEDWEPTSLACDLKKLKPVLGSSQVRGSDGVLPHVPSYPAPTPMSCPGSFAGAQTTAGHGGEQQWRLGIFFFTTQLIEGHVSSLLSLQYRVEVSKDERGHAPVIIRTYSRVHDYRLASSSGTPIGIVNFSVSPWKIAQYRRPNRDGTDGVLTVSLKGFDPEFVCPRCIPMDSHPRTYISVGDYIRKP
jgi:hypothetical protein